MITHPDPFVLRIKTHPAKQRRVLEHVNLLFFSSVYLSCLPRMCKDFEAFPCTNYTTNVPFLIDFTMFLDCSADTKYKYVRGTLVECPYFLLRD